MSVEIAHFPSQEEIKNECEEKKLTPSYVLLHRTDYITTKREDFKYALRRTLPRFFSMLKNLKYDGFPVQEPYFVIVGGVAITQISQILDKPLPLDTPDLDIELGGFDLSKAGNQANVSIDLQKTGSDFIGLFNSYIKSLMDQIVSMIEETPQSFDHYDEITREEINYDPEVRNGLVSEKKAGRFWICLVHPPRYFPKIVLLAKIGSLAGHPNIERVMELKLPSKIFQPKDPFEFITNIDGLFYATPAKMIPDLEKSLRDKCFTLHKLADKYDGPDGIFVKSLAKDGYWDVVEEPRDREAILTYKIRIITLRKRLITLGRNPDLVCAEYNDLQVIPYETPAEKKDKAERKARKKAEREAALAAAEAAAEEARLKKVAAIKQQEEERLAAAKEELLRREEEKRLAEAKSAKKAARAIKKEQTGRSSPNSDSSGEQLETVSASALAAAGGGPASAPASASATPKLRPDGVIYFIEGFAINPTTVINDLYNALIPSFPVPNPEGPLVFVLEANGFNRRRLSERAPLNPRIMHAIDDDSLNGAEEIACKIIPNLCALSVIEQGKLMQVLRIIGANLANCVWDIKDKEIRNKYIYDLSVWQGQASGQFSRAFLKDSMRIIFKIALTMFNILCLQVQKEKNIFSVLPAYEEANLFKCMAMIDGELNAVEPKKFTAKISDETVLLTRNLIEYLFVTTKVRNLLFAMDEIYPKYAAMVDVRIMPKPIIFFGLVSNLSSTMMINVQSFMAKAGVKKLTGIYTLTSEFLGTETDDRTPCQQKLYDLLFENLRTGREKRDLSIEITLLKSRYLWIGNPAIFQEICELLTLFIEKSKKENFTLCNTDEFWSKFSVNTKSISDFVKPYEENIAKRELSREQNLGYLFIDAELAAKKEAVLKRESEKEEAENDKLIEAQIAALIELGLTEEEATLQAAANRQALVNKAGKTSKLTKGKAKNKRTRKLRLSIH